MSFLLTVDEIDPKLNTQFAMKLLFPTRQLCGRKSHTSKSKITKKIDKKVPTEIGSRRIRLPSMYRLLGSVSTNLVTNETILSFKSIADREGSLKLIAKRTKHTNKRII